MRPSFELDSDTLAATKSQRGTERHTLADGPNALRAADERISLVDEFFSAGDEGRYEGGPATLEPNDEIELDETPVAVVLRTPEMDARRARFARGVAAAVGCMTAVLAIGLVRSRMQAAPSDAPERAAAQVVAHERVKPVAPIETRLEAKPALEPAGKLGREAKRETEPEARAEAKPEPTPEAKLEAKPQAKAEAPVTASKSAGSTFVAPPPTKIVETPAAPTRVLPSVANFAARAGDAAKSAGATPTAAFAPIR